LANRHYKSRGQAGQRQPHSPKIRRVAAVYSLRGACQRSPLSAALSGSGPSRSKPNARPAPG